MNWEKLREEVLKAGITNTRVVAEMPRRAPPRIMTGTTDGIEPVRDPDYGLAVGLKSKYYKKD